jgi:hypothetical protein
MPPTKDEIGSQSTDGYNGGRGRLTLQLLCRKHWRGAAGTALTCTDYTDLITVQQNVLAWNPYHAKASGLQMKLKQMHVSSGP